MVKELFLWSVVQEEQVFQAPQQSFSERGFLELDSITEQVKRKDQEKAILTSTLHWRRLLYCAIRRLPPGIRLISTYGQYVSWQTYNWEWSWRKEARYLFGKRMIVLGFLISLFQFIFWHLCFWKPTQMFYIVVSSTVMKLDVTQWAKLIQPEQLSLF